MSMLWKLLLTLNWFLVVSASAATSIDTLLSVESEAIHNKIQLELKRAELRGPDEPLSNSLNVQPLITQFERWKSETESSLGALQSKDNASEFEAAYFAVYLRLTESLTTLLVLAHESPLRFAEKNKITLSEEVFNASLESIRSSSTWVGKELASGRSPFILSTTTASEITLSLDTSRMVAQGAGNAHRKIDEKNLLEIIQISALSDLMEQLYRTRSLREDGTGKALIARQKPATEGNPALPLNRLLGGIAHFENQIRKHRTGLALQARTQKTQQALANGLSEGLKILPPFFDTTLLNQIFSILQNDHSELKQMVYSFFSKVEKEPVSPREIAELLPLSFFSRPLSLPASSWSELMLVKWAEIKSRQILGGLRLLNHNGSLSFAESGLEDALTQAVDARKAAYLSELNHWHQAPTLLLQKTHELTNLALSLQDDSRGEGDADVSRWNELRKELTHAAELSTPTSDKKIAALPVEPELVFKTLRDKFTGQKVETLAIELASLPAYSEQLRHYTQFIEKIASSAVIRQGRVVPALVEEFLHKNNLRPDLTPSAISKNTPNQSQFLYQLEFNIAKSRRDDLRSLLLLGEKCGFHRIFFNSGMNATPPSVEAVFSEDADARDAYVKEKRNQLRTTHSLLSLMLNDSGKTLGEALLLWPSRADALLLEALEITERKILTEIDSINASKNLDSLQTLILNGGTGLTSKYIQQADSFSPLLQDWVKKKNETAFLVFLNQRYGDRYVMGGFTALLLLELSKPILKRVPLGRSAASLLGLVLLRSKPYIRTFITSTALVSLTHEALEFKKLWSTVPQTLEDLENMESSHPFSKLDSDELFAPNPFAASYMQTQRALSRGWWMLGGETLLNTFLLYYQPAKSAMNRLGERLTAREIQGDIAAKRVLGMFPSAKKLEAGLKTRRTLPNRWDVNKSFSWTKKRLIAEGKTELIPVAERAFRRLAKKVQTGRTWDPEVVFNYHRHPTDLAVRYTSGKKWVTLPYSEWQRDLAAFQVLKIPSGDFAAFTKAPFERVLAETGSYRGLDPQVTEAYEWLKRRIATTGAWNDLSNVKIGPRYSNPTEKKLIEILQKSDSEARL